MNEKDLGMFTVGQNEEKDYIVKLGNQQASAKTFGTYDEAEAYIESKPWELIAMTAMGMIKMVEELNREGE